MERSMSDGDRVMADSETLIHHFASVRGTLLIGNDGIYRWSEVTVGSDCVLIVVCFCRVRPWRCAWIATTGVVVASECGCWVDV